MLYANPTTQQTVRIIVADHDGANRKTICRMLAVDRTFAVEEAATEDGLMALLADGDVSCVIVDRNLGAQSGFAVNDRVRAKYPDLPVVIMIAEGGSEGAAIKAFRCGFSDYLKKQTLTPRQLIDAVLRAVRRRRAEVLQRTELEYLAKLARLDRVTGLPNREFLEERLSMLVDGGKRHGHPFAVLVIDINEFKKINDSFGYVVGDSALRAFAGRLKQVSRASDTFGRLGADEFLYLIDWDVSAERTDLACRRLAEALSFSIELENIGLTLSSSIGAAIYPIDGEATAELLHAAVRAVESAKASGGGYSLACAPQTAAIVTPIAARDAQRAFAGSPYPGGGPGVPMAGDDGQLALMLPRVANDRPQRVAASPSPAPATPGEERVHREENRRAVRRQRVLKRGILITHDGSSTINCMIRDLSPGGARVTVDDEYAPDPHCLLLIAESGKRFSAETRWQRGRDIGLKFLDQAEPISASHR